MRESDLAQSIRSFQNLLIRKTVLHAAENSSFYGSHLKGKAQEVFHIQDLTLLPVVTKSHMRSQIYSDLLTSEKKAFVTQHTSGTTDKPFYVYRSECEVRFIQEYFKGHMEDLNRGNFSISAFQPSYHGAGISMPMTGQYRNFNLVDGDNRQNEVTKMAKFLTGDQENPIIITGIFQHIRYLTHSLIELGTPLERLPIAGIYVTGQYVSERWRTLLETTWDSKVVPRFSLTEGFGGALYCDQCGGYHFDQFCIAEALDPSCGEPIDVGIGILHLTSLFPFVQLMPFIRYQTGDIVEIFESECSEHVGRSFRFLGRMDHAQILETNEFGKLVVASAHLNDVLEKHSFVNVGNSTDKVLQTVSGSPCFRIRVEKNVQSQIIVDVELRAPTWIWNSELENFRAILHSELRASNPLLVSRLSKCDIKLDFNFLSPGSLGPLEPGSIPESSAHEYISI